MGAEAFLEAFLHLPCGPQWVENSATFKTVMNADAGAGEGRQGSEEIKLGLQKKLGKMGVAQAIQKTLSTDTMTSDDIGRMFEKAVAKTKPGLLTDYVLRLATSAEAYIEIRKRFSSTIATFNVASYLAGVGDRHLDNFLLDHSDGSVVGIDFGTSSRRVVTLLPQPFQ